MRLLSKLSCLLLAVVLISGSVYGGVIPAPLAVPAAGTVLSAPADTASLGAAKGAVKGYSDYVYYHNLATMYYGYYQSSGSYYDLALSYYCDGYAYYYYYLYYYGDSNYANAWSCYYWASAYYYYYLYYGDAGSANAYYNYYLADGLWAEKWIVWIIKKSL